MKKFGVLALAGLMMLWAAITLADDNPLIGKTYWVRQPSKMFAGQFTKVPLKRREALTVMAGNSPPSGLPSWLIVQRQSGEEVQIRTWIVEEAIQTREIVSEAPPPMPDRPKITYGPGEPEGYKNFKWGMTEDETGSVQTLFEDTIGAVSVTVSLRFLSEANALSQQERDWEPETLSTVFISFQSKDYETLKDIFIERYGKPTSSRLDPYQTQGGAKSTNETLMWKGPHSSINLSRYGNRITEGTALLGTNAGLEALSRDREKRIKDAAKGL
jgi:hypothetical protein